MKWLTRMPVIGATLARLMRSHAWRAYARMKRAHWTRLAAALTFTSFVALFPLLTVGAAIGAAVLPPDRLHTVQHELARQIPGISAQLDLDGFVDNAATVGVIAGALLLFTGAGWIAALRDCLRAVWEKDDEKVNPVLGRVKDIGLLLGLGGVAVVSFLCSAFASAAVGWAAGALGLAQGGVGSALLSAAGFVVAVLADFLLLVYVLTRLPGVHPPRRAVVTAGLIGAVGFELLKLLLSGYLQGVAAKSMYGAFGTPVALLLWINFTAKLVVFCATWTATEDPASEPEPEIAAEIAAEADPEAAPEPEPAPGASVERPAAGLGPGSESGRPPPNAPRASGRTGPEAAGAHRQRGECACLPDTAGQAGLR